MILMLSFTSAFCLSFLFFIFYFVPQPNIHSRFDDHQQTLQRLTVMYMYKIGSEIWRLKNINILA